MFGEESSHAADWIRRAGITTKANSSDMLGACKPTQSPKALRENQVHKSRPQPQPPFSTKEQKRMIRMAAEQNDRGLAPPHSKR